MISRRKTKMTSRDSTSRGLFVKYFESRPDIGFGKMLLDIALEPRSPFKPWEPRKVKKGFVVVVLFLLVACAWFGYFSLTG
jgi:hypothetical protein